jgi:hypothetical protein
MFFNIVINIIYLFIFFRVEKRHTIVIHKLNQIVHEVNLIETVQKLHQKRLKMSRKRKDNAGMKHSLKMTEVIEPKLNLKDVYGAIRNFATLVTFIPQNVTFISTKSQF